MLTEPKRVKKFNGKNLSAIWLQMHLEDYYNRKLEFDFTNHKPKEVQFRRSVIYLFTEFTGMQQWEIAKKFNTTATTICTSIQMVDHRDHDLRFLLKELKGELPKPNNYET